MPPPASPTTASALRRLYFVRFAFAIVWAVVMFTTADEPRPARRHAARALPAVRRGRRRRRRPRVARTGSPALLYVNIAISLLAAVGLAVAGASGIPAVLRVWGAWAVVAGLVQLIVGVTRRRWAASGR